MSYIFNELFLCLLIAAIIGGIIGWLLRSLFGSDKHSEQHTRELAERDRKIADLNASYAQRDKDYQALAAENEKTAAALTSATAVKAIDLRSAPVEEIEGIGPAIGKALRAIEIPSIYHLLQKGLTPEGRKEMHEAVISNKSLSKVELSVVNGWVSMADLLRVPGIGKQNAELMVASRVNSVGELRKQGAGSLASTMASVNERDHITTDKVPDQTEVARMIENAKSIEIELKDL